MAPTPLWKQMLTLATAGLVLCAVFSLYLQPEFMVDLAQQLWACF